MLLSDHQISILEASDSSIWISSSSPGLMTDTMRLTGATIAEDKLHLDLFIPQRYTHKFFKNVAENQHISFLCASVYTYTSFQVKGSYLAWRECTKQELVYQKAYMEDFANSLIKVGIKSGPAIINYLQEPCIAIRLRSEEIYEQTPKTGTGKKIGEGADT